jgi:hypothetical protein
MAMTLEAVALHALRRTNGKKDLFTIGSAKPGDLTQRTRERFTDYLDRIELRDEVGGQARAAWWATGKRPAHVAALANCALSDFGKAAETAVRELFKVTPGAASEGLVLFVRALRNGKDSTVACLKLELGALHDVRFKWSTDPKTAIEDLDVEGVLPTRDRVLKGALLPNPSAVGDLRIVDEQLPDPADHWLTFLDAKTRPGELAMSKVAAAALTTGVASATTLDRQAASAAVAEELEAVAKDTKPVEVKELAKRLAKRVNAKPETVLAAAADGNSEIKEPHYEVTPTAARRQSARYSLGDGIELKGPAHVLPKRVQFVTDKDGGILLQLRVPARVDPVFS